jgi:hypothetical protein
LSFEIFIPSRCLKFSNFALFFIVFVGDRHGNSEVGHLPMTKFAINSSVSTSTGFTPFELTYGYLPWIIQSVGESSFSGVQDFADNVRDMVIHAHNAIITSRVNQTHQANQWQQGDDPLLEVGRKAYLSTENLNLPKARARKLMPKLGLLWDRIRSD